MNRLKPEKQARMLHDLVEGGSLRSVERKHQVSFNTALKLFEEAGDMAISHIRSLGNLECTWLQVDEFYTYVATKSRDPKTSADPNRGTAWVYLAIDANTKFLVDFLVGTREVYDATDFMKSLASKLRRKENGEFAVRPTIVTDGLPAYKEATAIAFGTDADVGMMIKKYTDVGKKGQKLSRRRYMGADRVVFHGSPNLGDVHTSHIERANLNFRMDVKRFTRKTNAFSKTPLNCKRHIALYIMYYNYCRIHKALRMTPAMAAGVTDHIWEIDDLVTLTNNFVIERLRQSVANDIVEVEAAGSEEKPSHWVYHSRLHYQATIHEADCYHCKNGEGQRRGTGKAGTWYSFHSQADAERAAAEFEPDRYTFCKTCIGSYRNSGGYRGPRRRK